MTNANMDTVQLPGNQIAPTSGPETLATTDVEMSSDGIVPGERVQSLTFEDAIDLDQLLFEFRQAITESSPEEHQPDFISSMPQPVFDTEIFQKPVSPINASFADMNIDPRATIINQEFHTEYPAIMPAQQQAYYYPQATHYPAITPAPQQAYYYPQFTQYQGQPQFYAVAAPLQTSIPNEPAFPVQQLALQAVTPQLRRVLQPRTAKKPATAASKVIYNAEAPKKTGAFRTVRINASTIGLSTRTGKINNWDPLTDGGYVTPPAPLAWADAATGLTYTYNKWGELKSTTLTAHQLTTYLLSLIHI